MPPDKNKHVRNGSARQKVGTVLADILAPTDKAKVYWLRKVRKGQWSTWERIATSGRGVRHRKPEDSVQ
jgi:hypothetical protein